MTSLDMKLGEMFREDSRRLVKRFLITSLVFLVINIVSGLAFWIYCIPNFSKILEVSAKEILTTLAFLGTLFLLFIFLKFLKKILKIFEVLKKENYFIAKIVTTLDVLLIFLYFYKTLELGLFSINALVISGESTKFLVITGFISFFSIPFFLGPLLGALQEKENI